MSIPAASRVTRPSSRAAAEAVFLLESGARMDRATFHDLYLKTPPGFRAELIGGVVYVSSPVSAWHGRPHAKLVAWLFDYMRETPGTDVLDNTSTFLTDDTEPQPDAALLIDGKLGGQTTIDGKGYIRGAPELVAEIAHSTSSIDLGAKKREYENAGVREYLVILVRESQVHWFVRRPAGFEAATVGKDGVHKSEAFPGLWLDPTAFFKPHTRKLFAVAKLGLASPEHAAFVADLQTRRGKKTPPGGPKPSRKSK